MEYDPLVVSESILISNTKGNALLDSGASYSFISHSLVSKLKISVMHVDEVFNLVIPSSEEMISNIVVLKCPVGISNKTLFVDFIVLPIASFEVIIGIYFFILV